MLKTIYRLMFLSLLLWCCRGEALAQSGLRISLLTCGPGEEIYSVFGHTAVRIIDSNEHTDIVYNYGTFDGYDEDFELKFMRGKLLYYLSEDAYPDFLDAYGSEGRWVTEQVLQTSEEDKAEIQAYLLRNMRPENRAYQYDFFFDNCATRIRDIFTESQGAAFQYPKGLLKGGRISFRDIINRYLRNNKWERFGINILLGSKIDQPMTDAQAMFLPDYLRDAVQGATLNGKPFAMPVQGIVDGEKVAVKQDYSLEWVWYGMLVLLLAGLFIPRLNILGSVLANIVLIISGLLGVLILIMWFGTDHKACGDNFNLLWALPTNLMFLFKKKQYKYALTALLLLFAALLLHLFKIQCVLLPDMVPLLLMLVVIFAYYYKKYKKPEDGEDRIKA